MKTIILNGQLGKLFGRRHQMDVATAGEAVRGLVANFPSIEKYLIETKGVGYRVKLHDEPLQDIKQLHHPVGGDTITITPVIAGSKSGLGQVLLGAAIIVGAAILAPATMGGSIAWGAEAFSVFGTSVTFGNIAMVGVSLSLGGVVQMLSPTPRAGEPAERPDNKPSYVFSGPVNTTAQGHPVPVGYGRLVVGGAVISAGISTEEMSTNAGTGSIVDAAAAMISKMLIK